MDPNNYPEGWDRERVEKVIAHYDNATDDQLAAEDEAAFEEQASLKRIEWKKPWCAIDDHLGRIGYRLDSELRRVVRREHPLYGIPLEPIGRRGDCDDVLFRLLDDSERVAVVHLTYCSGSPDRAPWPITEFYEGVQDWVDRGMMLDQR